MNQITEVRSSSFLPPTPVSLSLVWKDLLTEDGLHLIHENPSSIISEMTTEPLLHTSEKDFSPMKEEILDHTSLTSLALEFATPISMPSSPSDHRRTSIRRQKRRTFPTPKDPSNSFKKRLRLDFDQNSNFNLESIPHSDNNSLFNEQQSIESKTHQSKTFTNRLSSFVDKRCRTVGKRNMKRTGTLLDLICRSSDRSYL